MKRREEPAGYKACSYYNKLLISRDWDDDDWSDSSLSNVVLVLIPSSDETASSVGEGVPEKRERKR